VDRDDRCPAAVDFVVNGDVFDVVDHECLPFG
jgi:hypothetical protein